ncbi:hypothetical protein [Alicyclobacillus acidocaldarius]|uniref:Uncharacterized protein n=1 Tax=Alicyclobacillus acidocaldarius (strain Tc-4-1) TaxID=1048834 RepID=F8II16_ALIAT|nr:hypothetical protein [Alicyclobacillus acidocaldarius]AEJ44496.1 hypothetical protein TC41_2601 [Alicyclobacillus acidocaldarius subsp. acidocaldarius Tc-4-1]
MKTLKGMDALEVAARYGITLYDTYYGNEVTVQEAREFIEAKRDPDSFILKDWPDTEEEAEDVLLMHIYQALREKKQAHGRVDLVIEETEGPVINVAAAELAALRLGSRRMLEVDDRDDGVYYHVPRTARLTDEFLQKLGQFVCEECRHFDLAGPYHEACLYALVNAIRRGEFELEDIVEERPADGSPLGRLFGSNFGMWSRRVSETKSRLQQAWKKRRRAVLSRIEDKREAQPGEEKAKSAAQDWTTATLHRTLAGLQRTRMAAKAAEKREEAVERLAVAAPEGAGEIVDALSEPAPDGARRERITKRALIRYLEQVEIVDESGEEARELADLRQRCIELEALLDSANTRYDRARAEIDRWKRQYEALKKDMDTVLQALQIARRHAGDEAAPTGQDEA